MGIGKLVVIEGGDGSGKSTQCELVKQHLESIELSYTFLHFPMYGDNEFSEVISKFLRGEFGKSDEVNPYFVANIFAMDQFLFLPKLNDLLIKYDVVLLDRYVFSNMAYQGAKYKTNSKESQKIIDWIYNIQFQFLKMPYPDLSLYIDVPIDIVKERLSARAKNEDRAYLKGKSDIHEDDMELQKRVHYNYKQICEDEMCFYKIPSVLIPEGADKWITMYSPDEIFESYKKKIDNLFEE